MSDQQNSRRNFLKIFGLTAGATVTGGSVLAAFIDPREVKKLSIDQQVFMGKYGEWMDKYTTVIRLQKDEVDNVDVRKQIIALADKAEAFQPELREYLKDGTFAFIFKAAIKRVTDEI